MNTDEIRAALAAATPGPWAWLYPDQCCRDGYCIKSKADLDTCDGVTHAMKALHADVVLIANAPTWLAELLAEVDDLRASLVERDEVVEEYRTHAAAMASRAEAAECKLSELERSMVELAPDPVEVEGNLIPAGQLAAVCGNYMRSSEYYAREAKASFIRAEAAEQAVRRVRDLHAPELAYDSEHHDCEPSECDRAGEGELYERCAHCSGFAWEQLWPCSTIRALDGGE